MSDPLSFIVCSPFTSSFPHPQAGNNSPHPLHNNQTKPNKLDEGGGSSQDPPTPQGARGGTPGSAAPIPPAYTSMLQEGCQGRRLLQLLCSDAGGCSWVTSLLPPGFSFPFQSVPSTVGL